MSGRPLPDPDWTGARCGSSRCRAPILWAYDEKGTRIPLEGRAMPPGMGEYKLAQQRTDGTPTAVKISQAHLRFGRVLYQSHFKTCPDRNHYRQTGPKHRSVS